jgi:hypothetical protein
LNYKINKFVNLKSTIFSNLFGPFEIYDTKITSEFSQKNIFYGLDSFFSFENNFNINKNGININDINECNDSSGMNSNNDRNEDIHDIDNIYNENTNKSNDVENMCNIYVDQILRQIEDKKIQLIYLQKHYE